MKKFLAYLSRLSSTICGYLLAVLGLLLFMDIMLRTAGHPIIGVAEISMYVMLSTVYLGMGNCEQNRGHVKIDFLTDRLRPSFARKILIFSGALSSGTLIVCTYAMVINTIDSFKGNEALAGLVPLTVWPIKAVMSFGIFLYLVQFIYNFISLIRQPHETATPVLK